LENQWKNYLDQKKKTSPTSTPQRKLSDDSRPFSTNAIVLDPKKFEKSPSPKLDNTNEKSPKEVPEKNLME